MQLLFVVVAIMLFILGFVSGIIQEVTFSK